MAKEIKKKKEGNIQFKLAILRYYKWITVVAVILIFALSYYFVLEPKYQQVGLGGQYNLDSLTEELDKRKVYLEELKKLEANYEKISQDEIEKLEKILPAKKDIPGLFVQFQALAEKHGFLLTSISINDIPQNEKDTQKVANLSRLSISLNLIGRGSGSYDEIKSFLSTIEYNMRLFDVNSVYFSPDSPDYSINLFTYYYEE